VYPERGSRQLTPGATVYIRAAARRTQRACMMTEGQDQERALSNGEQRLVEYVDELISAAFAEHSEAKARDTEAPDALHAADAPDSSPQAASGVRPRSPRRASMREGLASLFRDTAGHSPHHQPTPHSPDTATPGRSPYFRMYANTSGQLPELAPTGLPGLDARLEGGFGFGVHVVCGEPGVGRTAFAEAVIWEGLARGRTALYYALREGCLGAWERLIGTMGAILGMSVPPLAAIRARNLSAAELTTLEDIDRRLQDLVLPRLKLLDEIAAYPDALGAFLDETLMQISETRDRTGRTPIVVVDDLQRLLLLTGCATAGPALARLNEAFAAQSIPFLTTSDPSVLTRGESNEAASVLLLTRGPVALEETYSLVTLEVRADARTGWTGAMPLVLDRTSGLFAQALT
jgi:hypothetical protein